MNTEIQLPKDVKYIINKLYQNGEEAFAVGGCVRDALLGKEPKDWDICTSAEPNCVRRIFERTADTGIKHGTVTVILPHGTYEVTTYRIDGEYIDSRHPENVSFVKSLQEDLKRRDFTVNAMAYNDVEGLKDFHGGRDDLKHKLLRCVGNPDKRFTEDALRIMRALRFSAELMFDVESETAESAKRNKNLLNDIATERLTAELFKLVKGCGYDETVNRFEDVLNVFLQGCDLKNTIGKPANLRLFAMFDTWDGKNAMRRLKFPNKTITDILCVTQNPIPETLPEARRLCGKIGETNLKNLLLYRGKSTYFADIIKSKKLCCGIKDLNINGNDIIKLTGKCGKQIGEMLEKLLDAVINENTENEYTSLREYIKKEDEQCIMK